LSSRCTAILTAVPNPLLRSALPGQLRISHRDRQAVLFKSEKMKVGEP
jgi:hypothetical protein